MRRITAVTPSSAFRDNDNGSIVTFGKRRYCVLGRDPWVLHTCRVYWFDPFLAWCYFRYQLFKAVLRALRKPLDQPT